VKQFMITSNTRKLISTIFSLKRLIFDELKKNKLFDPKMHIQAETLFFIAEKQKSQMKDIAEHLYITPPSATSLINKLEKNKLIKRTRHPKDRRSVYIELTTAGKKFIKKINKEIETQMTKIWSPLNEEDQRTLINIYSKLFNYHKNQK
jgi:DNA-binding MarR family transcriptional regulator